MPLPFRTVLLAGFALATENPATAIPAMWARTLGMHRMEAHKGLVLAACRRKPAIFLRELRDRLGARGIQVSTSGLSRFFARHGISRRKGTCTQPSKTART